MNCEKCESLQAEIDRLKKGLETRQWVSVKDRLPHAGAVVHAWVQDIAERQTRRPQIQNAPFDLPIKKGYVSDDYWIIEGMGGSQHITHWMPLPEGPRLPEPL